MFKDYKQKKIKELIDIYDNKLTNLKNNSISHIVEYILQNPKHKYIISHSGGKDSTVIYDIWEKALKILKSKHTKIFHQLEWIISFSNTSNDTADTYKYIKTQLRKDKLNILNPKVGFYQWVIKVKNYFTPSVMVRNCCSTYKEGQINKAYNKNRETTMVIGVRKYESTARSQYDYIMNNDFRKKIHKISNLPEKWINFAPIVEWHDEEVWLYILKEGLKYNKQYDLGFNRCGCLICPFQSDYVDLIIQKYYPKQWDRWLKILEKNYELYAVKKRLKWSLEEWQQGRWKRATSKEQVLIQSKPTKEKIKELAEIKGISIELAEKYFKKKCNKCSKKLNPTEIAMNLKVYGRGMDVDKMQCKKCFCEQNDINKDQYKQMSIEFLEGGCELF